MDEFRTADGNVINPYATLKVDRHASRTEIRSSYRGLSKKYHPDAVRFRKIMPGSCDNLDQVRDEWERIKLSYEILSDKKLRMKYDRQSALNDPGKAFGRAAFETVSWGVAGLAKGIFHIGAQAVHAATDAAKKNGSQEHNQTTRREDAIVKDKRRKRKERMVQYIEVEHPTEKSGMHPSHNLSTDDSSTIAAQQGNLHFDVQHNKGRRRHQQQHNFEASGYSSLALIANRDTSIPSLSSIRKDVLAIGVGLNSLLQDETVFTQK